MPASSAGTLPPPAAAPGEGQKPVRKEAKRSFVLPSMKKRWDHRVDCFLVGIVVGLLSTCTIMTSELADGGLYVAVLATLTLPPLGLRLRTLDHGSLHGTALSITWQCVLGGIAVIAGLSVGITFGP